MDPIIAALVVGQTTTLACAATVAGLAVRAYRRTRAPALGTLAAGFVAIAVGFLAGGLAYQVVGLSVAPSVAIQSVGTAAGALAVTYSLFEDRPIALG